MAGLDGSDPLVFFGAFALLIFVGYLGNLIFDRFRFNDTVLLIALGLAIGPVAALWRDSAFVAAADVESAQPIIGALALILILFGGGMDLKFRDLLHGVGGASLLGVTSFLLTTLAVAGVAYALLDGVSFTGALILGTILGGTSALVVMPSLAKMKTGKRTSTMLSLESAITDILVVIGTFTLLTIATSESGVSAGSVGGGVFLLFLVSLAVGSLVGLLWLWLVPYVRDKQFGYMMTLGAALAVYVFTEAVLASQGMSEGGGPLAVLAFGILLGNSTDMWHGLKQRVGDAFGKGLSRFQSELAFLVRTFFFVYLGILVDLSLLADLKVLGVAGLVFVAMLGARYVAVALTVRRLRLEGEDWVLFVMMPRGLAAAVLAAAPAAASVSGSGPFVAIAFTILVLTNLLATFGGMALGKDAGKSTPPASASGRRRARSGKQKATAAPRAAPARSAPAAGKRVRQPKTVEFEVTPMPRRVVLEAPPLEQKTGRTAPTRRAGAERHAMPPPPSRPPLDDLPRRPSTARGPPKEGPPMGFRLPPPPVPLSSDPPARRNGPPF